MENENDVGQNDVGQEIIKMLVKHIEKNIMQALKSPQQRMNGTWYYSIDSDQEVENAVSELKKSMPQEKAKSVNLDSILTFICKEMRLDPFVVNRHVHFIDWSLPEKYKKINWQIVWEKL